MVFASVYEYFSHEVLSGYMLSAFVYPLMLGAGGLLAVRLLKLPAPSSFAMSLQGWSIACLTVGNIMNGVFEIYGTESGFTKWYYVAGGLIFVTSCAVYLAQIVKNKEI